MASANSFDGSLNWKALGYRSQIADISRACPEPRGGPFKVGKPNLSAAVCRIHTDGSGIKSPDPVPMNIRRAQHTQGLNDPIDSSIDDLDPFTSAWICSIRRPVAHITVQIRIPRREADGVDLQPAAEPGGVFAGAVVLQQRIVVEFAGGEGEAAAVRGGGFRSDISVGVVVDRVEHHARVIDDAADGAEVVRQQPAEVAGVGAGDEIVDRIRPEVASCQRTAGVQVGIDLEAGEIVAGFIGIPTVYGELLSRRGRAARVAVRVQNSLDAVAPSVVAVGYTKIDVGAIGFSLDFRQLIVVVVRIEPFFGGAADAGAFDEVAVVVVGEIPEAVGAVLVFAGGGVGAVVRAAGGVDGFAVAVVAVGVGGCPGGVVSV